MLNINLKYVNKFINQDKYNEIKDEVIKSNKLLVSKKGLGNEFLGWLEYPNNYDKNLIDEINNLASTIKKNAKVLIVVGIGGSYLGAKSCIDLFTNTFKNDFEVIFAGFNLSDSYLTELIDYIKDKEFYINVISKSGTTLEPAVSFRILEEICIKKYKEESINRIICTTDKQKGTLYNLALKKGYKRLIVPDDMGGRFSVLSSVGLLPIACANIDIKQILNGAKQAYDDLYNKTESAAITYATLRNYFYQNNKEIEVIVANNYKFRMFQEWLKQLYCETEGKDNKGLFVSSLLYTTDLHSIGQLIQDGKRNMFETVLKIKENDNIKIKDNNENLDELNYISGKSLAYINEMASLGTIIAHHNGNVPNIIIEIDSLSYKTYGYLVYFFFYSIALSAYTLKVNPFDQPGVEGYKKNMFALLDKKEYKEIKEKIIKDIK